MSELIDNNDSRTTIRWKLLTGASALVLTAAASAAAAQTDTGRPQIWIELGGQLERQDSWDQPFQSVFEEALKDHGLFTPRDLQQPPRYATGGEAKLTFAPQDSQWSFSAALRYGRSNGHKHRYQQTRMSAFPTHRGLYTIHPSLYDISDTQVRYNERHAVLDFQAGKDVGLGFLGGPSTVGFGIRFAQFSLHSSMTAYALPHATIHFPAPKYFQHILYNRYTQHAGASRSFHGIGPSIFWNGSVPVAGNASDTGLGIDWGLSASVLFGHQRASTFQRTHEEIWTAFPFKYSTHEFAHNYARSRSVIVPNAGAFAAISLDFPNAKVALGYRADFFFNAIDGGIGTRKEENRGFYGPYASISIGLGD